MKLYLYGYLNRIQSSRRLERECQRNVELMWLVGKLAPDFKTIADFRRDNGEAIRNVCREFTLLCRKLDLFSQSIVAIDGSKFKAVNAHDRNFTRAKLEKRMQQIDQCIERYLAEMDTADRQKSDVTEMRASRLREKIATLKKDMAELRAIETKLNDSVSGQVSLTDPDARAMATSNSRGLVGYAVFYWPAISRPAEWQEFRVAGEADDSRRPLSEICSEELANLAIFILSEHGATSVSELARTICRPQGIARTTADAEARIVRALQVGRVKEFVQLANGTVSLTKRL